MSPRHEIRPDPRFVEAALEPGDTVHIELRDGTRFSAELAAVDQETLLARDGSRIAYADIETLYVYALHDPATPCAETKSTGCSIRLVFAPFMPVHAAYSGVFNDACMQHDFCYRHGHATYGYDKAHCDREFRERMMHICHQREARGKAAVTEQADTVCEGIANDYYDLVANWAERYFETERSTYCEYD